MKNLEYINNSDGKIYIDDRVQAYTSDVKELRCDDLIGILFDIGEEIIEQRVSTSHRMTFFVNRVKYTISIPIKEEIVYPIVYLGGRFERVEIVSNRLTYPK